MSLGTSHMKRRTAYIHHFKFGAKVCLKKILQLCFYQLAGLAVDFAQFQAKSTSIFSAIHVTKSPHKTAAVSDIPPFEVGSQLHKHYS